MLLEQVALLQVLDSGVHHSQAGSQGNALGAFQHPGNRHVSNRNSCASYLPLPSLRARYRTATQTQMTFQRQVSLVINNALLATYILNRPVVM
jgi:hypothetical protein